MDAGTTTVVLFLAGLVAGTLNVIAGGGSLLTLPLMIFLGLPASVANGTNRVALLVQNVGAVWGYHGHGVVDWKWFGLAALPGLLGAGVGTWFALWIDDLAFERVLSVVLVLVAVWTIWNPMGKREVGDSIVGEGEIVDPGRSRRLQRVIWSLGRRRPAVCRQNQPGRHQQPHQRSSDRPTCKTFHRSILLRRVRPYNGRIAPA